MSLKYTTTQKDKFLVVTPEGSTDSPDELMGYIDELLGNSSQLELHKVLMDHRKFMVQMEHAGAYDIANRCIERMKDDRTLRVAVVARPERMEFARIYESIGINRGVSIKAFDSMKMAASWLIL